MDQVEHDIYNIWSELQPTIAFQCGVMDRAGNFFIPTEDNVQNILKKIDVLRMETIDSVNHGLLNYYETFLKYEEPHLILWNALWAYFGYLVKEGVNISHMDELTKNIGKALNIMIERLNHRKWSMENKIITTHNYLGLLGVIETIQKEEPKLKPVFNELREQLKTYMKKYIIPEIKNGDFSEVFPILEKKGGNIGRKELYPEILKNIWGYPETPMEIESQALTWLNEELQKLTNITEKLANIFNIEPSVEVVSKMLIKRSNVSTKNALDLIKKLRGPLRNVIEKNIVRITPKYDTRLMETPPYLLNLISTAAMQPFNLHTNEPFNIFFVTTDNKRSPPTSVSDLFQLIIHEEFGHCVHFSNSATKFKANTTMMELIYTKLALPISDGISFYREWESLQLLKTITTKPIEELDEAETQLINILKSVNDIKLFMLEFEFTILRWRIIRFLRAIGDIRINMHKQSITEFISWASEYTGLSKKFIFDQIFLFQAQPGYAPCYSIAGDRIQSLQTKAKERGRTEIDFNSFASSLGFPTRGVFEQKLKDF